MQKGIRTAMACAALLFAGLGTIASASDSTPAAASPSRRTILQRVDVPGSAYEVVYVLVEIGPHADVAPHTHPGTVLGYLLEGDFSIHIDGQPMRSMKPGETLQIPSGAVHDEHTGAQGAKILAVFSVEKGKPLTSPAQ